MKPLVLAAAALLLTAAPGAATGRQVSFPSTDGTPLAATLYEPSSRPAPAIVLVHMLGRSKEDWSTVAERLEDAGAIVLALDLRGHGRSGGSMATLLPMIDDVRAAVAWVAARPGTRPDAVAIVGASLGANLALVAAADTPAVRAIALLSPSLDYRGIRLDASLMRKIADRPVWLAASTQDPYALRTIKELVPGSGAREQRLSAALAHGTTLLSADSDLARALVDWLRRTLIY
jgi:alpha-beta hydrolase superfamily lysophospholipase